jgi:hypothetical protein
MQSARPIARNGRYGVGMDRIPRLASARQAAQAFPIPGLSEAACARRYTFLAYHGVIPLGVQVRLLKRVFFDLPKLGQFLANGGSGLRKPPAPGEEQTVDAYLTAQAEQEAG